MEVLKFSILVSPPIQERSGTFKFVRVLCCSSMSVRSLGDVVARSPSCVTVPEDASVFSLAEALSVDRVDAAAVLSSGTNGLTGIATSRDVAKCIARGENLELLKVSEIMTAHPVTLPPAETPANALALMREGGFRHIPVVSEENGCILGIVDVLSLAYDAITRLQVSYSMMPTRRGFEFMRAARDTMEKPTLRPIVERTPVATLTRENSVVQACETLVREHIAAIVIVDNQAVLDGIFTCRDVVNRVVVERRNPVTTRLGQVMTPNPDSAAADFTILESLQRMQACGFRHLPVVENHTRVVVGICDVLQLASSAISGMGTIADHTPASHSSVDSSTRTRTGQSRGLSSIFSSLFSNPYASREYENVNHDFETVHRQGSSSLSSGLPMQRSVPLPSARRHYSYLGSDHSSSNRYKGMPNDVALASFKFKDLNDEYRRIKVPTLLEHGAYDQFVVDVRRRFAGSSRVGPIKIKYIDEDGDEVLISNDEDLASCFEDFVDSKNKTIQLKVYEVERPSSSHLQSPVSSNASSIIGSPRHQALASGAMKPDGQDTLKASDRLPPTEGTSRVPSIARAASRPVIQTPSMQKVSEAQAKMLDEAMDEAIVLYGEAMALDPDNARAQGGRGAAHLISGNSTGAEEDYRAAIALLESGKGGTIGDVTFEMCIVGLVESLIDQRRYEEAAEIAGRIDSKSGNIGCVDAFRDELDSAGNAAREALEAGEFGDAMSCYSNALRVESAYLQLADDGMGRASLRLGRAKCYKALEDFDMALEDYEAAVKLEPESVAGHKGCGKCLAELEQMDRALEAYERARKLDPADDEVNKEIEIIRSILPDPLESKRAEIAKLGAVLGGMKLRGKQS